MRMGYQAEQRVLAVLKVNRGRLTDPDNATRKMCNYMAVTYSENSVSGALLQLERRGLIGRSMSGGACVAIFAKGALDVDDHFIQELRLAIGHRLKVKRGRTDVAPPAEWDGPRSEYDPAAPRAAKTGASQVITQAEEQMVDPKKGIDYRCLADSLLLEVLSVLTDNQPAGDPEEAERYQALYTEANSRADGLATELETINEANAEIRKRLVLANETHLADRAEVQRLGEATNRLEKENQRLHRELTEQRAQLAAIQKQAEISKDRAERLQQDNRRLTLAADSSTPLIDLVSPDQAAALQRIADQQ